MYIYIYISQKIVALCFTNANRSLRQSLLGQFSPILISIQEDVACIDSIAKGQLMTAEEEEDVIKIDQANIAPCDTPALACVAFVACVILSSNTLARSSKILRWTLNLLDSSRLSGTCRTYRTLIQDLYVLNILESDTSLKAFEAAMFAHFFL